MGEDATPNAGVRLDKWLWAARFFKTRALATSAVRGGHVQVQGERVKPARVLKVGQRVVIVKGELIFEVDVLALAERRGSAAIAQTLYSETEESVQARAVADEARRLRRMRGLEPATGARPDRRDRRARQQLRER